MVFGPLEKLGEQTLPLRCFVLKHLGGLMNPQLCLLPLLLLRLRLRLRLRIRLRLGISVWCLVPWKN